MKIYFHKRIFIRLVRIVLPLFTILMMSGCIQITSEPGNLVPPTVDQKGHSSRMKIEVAGHKRFIHYKTFGDSSNPVLLILHGSLSDMRAYLPLKELCDNYFVVMWDQRGNGLSERVTAEELTYDAMVDEIRVIKDQFAHDRPVSLLGHSWSAVFVAMYLAKYPDEVEQAVLMEPFGLKSEFMNAVDIPLNLTSRGYLDMMFESKYMTPGNHEILDYQMLAMLKSGVRNYFCDSNQLPDWPVWRVGGFALICWEKNLLHGRKYDYDFTKGLADFMGEVLLVGSECSPIGYQFQKKYHQTLFHNATVLRIPHSGHRIITENYDALLTGLRDFLRQYKIL